MSRTVEVYTGAYAGGKSEIAINRAIMLKEQGKKVTIVDLDTVEPAYTLRPLKNKIEEYGVNVVTQESYFGLGETGNIVTPAQIKCLSLEENLVIDVGYGVGGLDVLEIIDDIDKEEDLRIYIVINISKFETSNAKNIIDYIRWSEGQGQKKWKKFAGIISNTHFGDDSNVEDAIRGYLVTKEAAKELNLPIKAICVSATIKEQLKVDEYEGVPVWTLNRFMPKALW